MSLLARAERSEATALPPVFAIGAVSAIESEYALTVGEYPAIRLVWHPAFPESNRLGLLAHRMEESTVRRF